MMTHRLDVYRFESSDTCDRSNSRSHGPLAVSAKLVASKYGKLEVMTRNIVGSKVLICQERQEHILFRHLDSRVCLKSLLACKCGPITRSWSLVPGSKGANEGRKNFKRRIDKPYMRRNHNGDHTNTKQASLWTLAISIANHTFIVHTTRKTKCVFQLQQAERTTIFAILFSNQKVQSRLWKFDHYYGWMLISI